MARARRGAALGSAVALALVLAACGGGGGGKAGDRAGPPPARSSPSPAEPAPTSAQPEPGADCLTPRDSASPVHFGPKRALAGYVLGAGTRYVVLAHQSSGDSCQMLPLGRGLAAAGYRILAFDFTSSPSVTANVLSAIRYCRSQGATSVSLAGASMGGYAVLSAALLARPSVDAVVSLSAPAVWDDPQGKPVDIARLRTPVQLWAARYDTQFATDAKALARAQPSARLRIVPGVAHGVELVPTVLPQVVDFLDTYSR